MIAAQDETYRDAKNIHSKWMRHQAFESEIVANKDRLEKLIKASESYYCHSHIILDIYKMCDLI